jgi:hypothetical protein
VEDTGGRCQEVMFVFSGRSVGEEHKHVPVHGFEFISPLSRAKLTWEMFIDTFFGTVTRHT